MADRTVEFLNAKIAETQGALYDLRMRANALTAQLDAYVQTLRMIQSDTVVSDRPQSATDPFDSEEHSADDDGNNADAVRQFIKDRGSRGTRPSDLNKFFEATKLTVHKSYAYSILARLKRRKEITSRNGKYFPTQILLDRLKPGDSFEEGRTTLIFETQKEAIAAVTALAS